jgi:hypothetical protein
MLKITAKSHVGPATVNKKYDLKCGVIFLP